VALGGSACRAENGGHILSPPDLSRRDKGLLLVLLVDLHNGTSTKKHIRVKGPLPATGLRRLGMTKGKLNFWI